MDNQAYDNYLSIEDVDEEDPLEAFMADINNKAAEEKSVRGASRSSKYDILDG